MDFGMPTLIELAAIEDCAALCRELGLDFLELNMNLPAYQPGAINAVRLEALAGKFHIYFTIHLDENLNVSDFNPHVAAAYRRTVLEVIELAKRLGTPVINMHLSRGVYFTLPDRRLFLFDAYRDQYLQSMAAFRDECTAAIGDSPLKICVENCGGYADFQIEALDLLLESPAFGLTLDVGHSACAGGTDERIILARASRLHHMHLHDARLGGQDHLSLGEGELDVPKYLSLAAAHQCRAVLETKTVAGLRQSIRFLRRGG